MKSKIKTIFIYTLAIVISTIASIEIGSEIITQYSMHANGYTGIERHHLADDMGFGMLLMFGLIPEIILGVICGSFIGKIVSAKFKST